jgi:hypothetical protein
MRIITNTVNPATLFWYAVYAMAIVLFFVGGIVVGKKSRQDSGEKLMARRTG